eukprot:CAMPEP_0194496592 /NCGR_PEP_ID=MMETSP0253-20130528/13817_1 /TAXON_ID=2966 /ORGANISM="Noctiluca scintillans" /LENGTH=115 /DNA_ID=CAMNT_0039338011 /DNA_START=720 /DNA_END=1064 /DNA_ORIENTATION=-
MQVARASMDGLAASMTVVTSDTPGTKRTWERATLLWNENVFLLCAISARALSGFKLSKCSAKCLAATCTLSHKFSSLTKASDKRLSWIWFATDSTVVELISDRTSLRARTRLASM